MLKKMISTGLLATAMISTPVSALDFDQLYVGGGLSMNSVSGFDSAMGYQAFAGLPLDMIQFGPVKSAAEVGFMSSGDLGYSCSGSYYGYTYSCPSFSASGLWATYVASMDLADRVTGIARAGLDLGDDDGLMVGFGADYSLNDKIGIRAEYVIRDNINSLQANVTYRLK